MPTTLKSAPVVPSIGERMDTIESTLASLAESLASIARSAPVKTRVKSRARTFATLAERKAGNGFSCTCGRNDLRTAPHAGSFHRAPDGTLHTL